VLNSLERPALAAQSQERLALELVASVTPADSICSASPPMAFIFEWNSTASTPSPRSTRLASASSMVRAASSAASCAGRLERYVRVAGSGVRMSDSPSGGGLRGQVQQQRRHAGVREVRGNLGAHRACTEHRHRARRGRADRRRWIPNG
jgi:hypothetical protein